MVHKLAVLVSVVVLLSLAQEALQAVVNNFDQEFTFTCPSRQFLSRVNSKHNSHHEDREFDLDCRIVPSSPIVEPNCLWSGYVNEFDQPVAFQCSNNGYIAGISSYHHNHHEDRRFNFYCCSIPASLTNCYLTDWQNTWDRDLRFDVPAGQILTGITSFHNNHHEDRRFKFNVCTLRP